MKHVEIRRRRRRGWHVHVSKSVSQAICRLAPGRVVSWGWIGLSLFNRLQQVPLGAFKLSWGSLARAAAIRSLIELVCCKLKKTYALCENFIYTGQPPVLPPGPTGSDQVRSGRTSTPDGPLSPGPWGSQGSQGSRDSLGSLSFMTAATYNAFVENQLLPTLHHLDPKGDWIIIMNNALIHRSEVVSRCYY